MEEQYGTAGDSSSGTDKAKEKAHEAKEKASELKHRAEEKADAMASEARDLGKEAVREGKEKARELSDDASRKARSRAEEQKGRLAGGMRTMADALRNGTDQLPEDRRQYGSFLETVADQVENASRYLDERDVDGLTREARQFARQQTPLFLGGAFALGMAGARFLKSSASEAWDESTWEEDGERPRLQSTGMGTSAGRTTGMAEPGTVSGAGSAGTGSRTEEWTKYERDPAPAYPRSSTVREAADRIQKEGGYE